MEDWNNTPESGNGGNGYDTEMANDPGYETQSPTQPDTTEPPVSSGKRNYERYMAGETWTPQQPQNPFGNEQPRNQFDSVQPQNPFGDTNPHDQDAFAQSEWGGGYKSSQNWNDPQPSGGYDMQPARPVDYHGLEEPVSVGEWMIAMLIMMVPCLNIIFMFIWAFGGSEKKSKSNYFKATLIFAGVLIGIYVVGIILALAVGFGFSSFF